MNKIKLFEVALVAVMFLGSCSGPSERAVTVKDVEISGFSDKYLKVVDGDYKFTNDGDDAYITVQFELIKKPISEVCRKKHPEDIRLNPIGNGGSIFNTGVYGFVPSRSEMGKLKDLLNNGKIGDKVRISFTWGGHFGFKSSKEKGKLIFKKSTSFEIIDNTFGYCNEMSNLVLHWDDGFVYSSSSDNTNSNVGSSSNSNNEDWDKVLKSYESYIDQYIKLMKKAQNGDMDALTEYAKMMENATELSEKMSKAGNDMSTSQMAKYMKLQTKLINAAADLQK